MGIISWPKKPIKALGVYFGHDRTEVKKLNWDNKLEKIEELLKGWKKRFLTIFGKVTILKTLVISKVTFLASMITVPSDILRRLNNILYEFLWGGKRGKIKRAIVINKAEKGGINMIDIESMVKALKCRWVHRLMRSCDETWKIVAEYYFKDYGGSKLIFCYNIDKRGLKLMTKKLPSFYREILTNWYDFRNQDVQKKWTPNSIGEQIIWGNKFIQSDNKPLFFQEWIEAGILYVADVFQNGQLIQHEYVLNKLKCKRNWISQYVVLKKAIPKSWWKIMKSVRHRINIRKGEREIIQRDSNG